MANETPNYHLKKPLQEDFYDIDVQNENMDSIDTELKKLEDDKVDKVSGKQLSSNDYTTVEKDKLGNIAEKANNYTHPPNHQANMIVENANKRFVSDEEKAVWGGKANASHTHVATDVIETSEKKFVSAEEKNTWNGKANSTDVNAHIADKVQHITAGERATWNATSTNFNTHKDDKDSHFTAIERTKLANVSEGANNYVHPANHPYSMITGTPASLPANGGNANTVNGYTVNSNVPAGAVFTDTIYNHPANHPASMITGLATVATSGNYNDLSNKPAPASGKKYARFTIGTITAGWTSADVDYLCDGTDDQVEINQAIQALPSTGGEIVILNGTYNITATILVDKVNVSIRGNGASTRFQRLDDMVLNAFKVSANHSRISNLLIDLSSIGPMTSTRRGIELDKGNNAKIEGVILQNIRTIGIWVKTSDNVDISNSVITNCGFGINFTGNKITVGSNIILDNTTGILVGGTSSVVTDNCCFRGTGLTTDYSTSEYPISISESSKNNLISNNNILGKNISNAGTNNTILNNKY